MQLHKTLRKKLFLLKTLLTISITTWQLTALATYILPTGESLVINYKENIEKAFFASQNHTDILNFYYICVIRKVKIVFSLYYYIG